MNNTISARTAIAAVAIQLMLSAAAFAAVVTVDSGTDVSDAPNLTTIENLIADPGADLVISLREAIIAANNNPGQDSIEFTNTPFIITLTAAGNGSLPALTDNDGLFIEGDGSIFLDGDGLGTGLPILEISSDNNVVKRLMFGYAFEEAILISGGNNAIQGCYIGTDGVSGTGNGIGIRIASGNAPANLIGGSAPADRNYIGDNFTGIVITGNNTEILGNWFGVGQDGTTVLGNGSYAIDIQDGQNNLVGGELAGEGNVIVNCGSDGIRISGSTTSNNFIKGNIIGLSPDRTLAMPNSASGVAIFGLAGSNAVGGTGDGAGNIIGANGIHGIYLEDSDGNTIQGNFIGYDPDSLMAWGNTGSGLHAALGSSNNLIGGADPGAANTIAHNLNGVLVSGIESINNTISANSIFENTNLGISIEGGANNGVLSPSSVSIGSVSGMAPAGSTVEIFADTANQGRFFIDSVIADGGNNFASDAPLFPFEGLNVTTTATDMDGNTSEFSDAVTIPQVAPDVTSILRTEATPTNSVEVTYIVSFTEPVEQVNVSDFEVTGTVNSPSVIMVAPNSMTPFDDTYFVTVNTGMGDGTLRLDINDADNSVTDQTGNAYGGTAMGETYTVDKTAPTPDIGTVTASPTNLDLINFDVSFGESVTQFVQTDIEVTNGTVQNFSGIDGDASYPFQIAPATDGVITIAIPASVAIDAAGNPNEASSTINIISDRTSPSVTLSSTEAPVTNLSPIPVRAAFTESVFSFSSADVTLTNGTLGNFTPISASEYEFNVTPGVEGDVTIGIPANAAEDNAMNTSNAASPLVVEYDITPPTVAVAEPSLTETANGPVSFPINYTGETAITLTPGDVEIVATGTASATVSIAKASRTATLENIDGEGELRIRVLPGTASDAAGNTAPASNLSAGVIVILDSDSDGIPDEDELPGDADGDGVPNVNDPDSDNDGIIDGDDGLGDPDNDSLPNYVDPDSDNDGIEDGDEQNAGLDRLDPTDAQLDPDGDGLTNAQEINRHQTQHTLIDSDGDGMTDGFEALFGLDPLDAGDASVDSDGDTLINLEEFLQRSNPRNANSPVFTVFVAIYGDDAAGNGSRLAPFRTIAAAQSRYPASIGSPVRTVLLPGTYSESVALQEGQFLTGSLEGEAVLTSASTTTVLSAAGARIRRITLRENAAKGSAQTLLRMTASMRVRDVRFEGTRSRSATGIRVEGPDTGQSVVASCEFQSLAIAVDIAGATPTVRRCVFRNIGQTAIYFRSAASKQAGGSVGDASNPSTGYNTFDFQEGDGDCAIINESGDTVLLENNDWGTDNTSEIENLICGPHDADPAIAAGSGILAAVVYCILTNTDSLAPITGAEVSAGTLNAFPSDEPGVYSFDALPAGNYTLLAMAADYNSPVTRIVEAPDGEITVVNMTMMPLDSPDDCDGDGLGDTAESGFETESCESDSDADGNNDDLEIAYDTDPNVPNNLPQTDLNDDGESNAVDVQLVINGALGLPVLPGLITDVNGDMDTNAVDVQIVINAVLTD